MSHVVVLCSVGSLSDAERLARGVVEAGHAACASVLPGLTSFYRWKGELQRDPEVLLLIKTRADRVDALRSALVAGHPYEVPEVLALPVVAGHPPYLAWIDASLA